jgi:hypothetical protein
VSSGNAAPDDDQQTQGVPMNSLDKIKTMAQREADKSRRTMLVLNLNPFSPLYVVREWSQRARDSRDFVCEIEPSMYV